MRGFYDEIGKTSMTSTVGQMAREKIFDYTDSNKDGKADFGEIVRMEEKLNVFESNEETKKGIDSIDTNKDGMIELSEL
jgi:Ca2+-binding EF-hand superfamily protein